ncbi:unnamed protein product [Schistosoma margrebowiei]|uniref:Uncharacterized protein n=1 Tax=Schistosoma margrebowiei TaxID=48269 RepID=A0AA85A7J3_9TREM|nr:unnamed protein product [Schistosoma margrebowiei]
MGDMTTNISLTKSRSSGSVMCCVQTKSSHFKQCKGEANICRTSGFVSNIRPSIRYNCKLDEKDNPAFRNILSGNYLSTNHKDFLPYSMPSGKETLPYLTNQLSNETSVSKVFSIGNNLFEQKFKDIFAPILPKGKLVLPTKAGPCNIEDENFRHGLYTYSMTDVVHYTRIEPRPCKLNAVSPIPLSLNRKLNDMFKVAVGRKEESGSTRSISNFNAISNRFRYSFTTVQPGWKTDKLASQTAYMSDFRPFCHKNGSEPFSNWVGDLSYQKPTDYVIQNKIWPEYKSHHPYYIVTSSAVQKVCFILLNIDQLNGPGLLY